MYSLIIENAKGEQLTFNELGGAFTITDIDGLNPPNAKINTSEMSLIDGQLFDSAKLEMRTLNIAFAIEYSAAANRIAAYKVLRTKQWVKVYYSSAYRNVSIEGYVQSFNINYFDKKQIATVSILCPSPYWKAAQTVANILSQTVSLFHFAFASTAEPEIVFGYVDPMVNVEVDNDGEVATGIVIELYASTTIGNPKIIDYITGDYIALDFTMQAGDLITIDTREGEKTITLLRNAQETNIFNSLVNGSKWLQVDVGGGLYTYEVGSGSAANLTVTINHTNLYEGV